MDGLYRRLWLPTAQTVVALSLVLVLVSVAMGHISASFENAALNMLAVVTLVVSLYVFSGNSGVFSFGHMALAMVGGYAGAILAIAPEKKTLAYPDMLPMLQSIHGSPEVAILFGGVCGAIAGTALAAVLMRLSGLTAGLATFVVLLIAYSVATSLQSVTNGSSGLSAIEPINGLGAALPWPILAVVVAGLYQTSRSCARLRASREDEFAAKSVGVGVGKERGVAFVLSSFLAGMGGALYALVLGSVGPTMFYLGLTTTVIAMLVIGGRQSLTGAVLGAVLISLLNEAASRVETGFILGPFLIKAPTGLQQLLLAVFLLGVLIWRRNGIFGSRELRLGRPWAAGAGRSGGASRDDSEGGLEPIGDREVPSG